MKPSSLTISIYIANANTRLSLANDKYTREPRRYLLYAYLRVCVCEFLVASALVFAKQVLGFHVIVRTAAWT